MADAMSFTCPTCHAAPGRTCRGDLPPVPVKTHLTRMLAAMRVSEHNACHVSPGWSLTCKMGTRGCNLPSHRR
jgi:hypothetical protein